jgi:hypothetical protein
MASLRILAIGILKHHGTTNIAKALRHNARDAYTPLTLLGTTTPWNRHSGTSPGLWRTGSWLTAVLPV